jgi:hypothetical protein
MRLDGSDRGLAAELGPVAALASEASSGLLALERSGRLWRVDVERGTKTLVTDLDEGATGVWCGDSDRIWIGLAGGGVVLLDGSGTELKRWRSPGLS